MGKKITTVILALGILAGLFAGCTGNGEDKNTLKVAVLESAYGSEMWEKIVDEFEKDHEGVTVELVAEKNLEDVIGAQMKSGDYPDVVHLATGREAGLTETMIRDNMLTEMTDVLEMTVPGESVRVKDKLIPGFTDTLATNPYSDGKTYFAPMFYGPCGLFYNRQLFIDNNWELPETWEDMFILGDKAKEKGIYLFTYPTTGYFDAFFYALLASAGGTDFYNRAMRYEEGIWDTQQAKMAFDTVNQLAKYTEPTTVSNANNDNFLKNQQLVLDNKALFMPNGTWVVGEMADAPRAEGFEWGFMPLPAFNNGDRYSFTFFEQLWIPKEAKNPELAKEFVAYLYSDEAVDIFAEAGAIQPVKGVSADLKGDSKLFYSIYDNGAKAVMGGFAATEPVEGVSIADSLFGTIDSLVSGNKTLEDWMNAVKAASDRLREALK